MGIIERQATRTAIYSYLGALLGFATVMWCSHLLSPDENGLIRLLVSVSILIAQFAGLGFNSSAIRHFPEFRNKENGHNGFLFYGIVTTGIGFLLFLAAFFLFQEQIISSNQEKSKLFADYIYYLIPLALFTLFFNLFDYYLRACYSAVIGSSAKDFTQRILILCSLASYFFGWLSFPAFLFLYVLSVCIPTLILWWYIIRLGEWHVKPVKGFVSPELRKEMVQLGLFTIVAGGAGMIISNIDVIMVNQKLGLAQAGIYGIAFYFGTIIIIPSRSLLRIATSIVSEAFNRKDFEEIKSLYRKSCNSQLAIGVLLFAGIWANLPNIMQLLPPEYADGKNVILFVALGYLVDMATGMNYTILIASKHYRYDGYFMLITLFITVVANHLLIPILGIMGSAIATALAMTVYNVLRWLFLYWKYGLQPYDTNTLKLVAIFGLLLLPGFLIPEMPHFLLDIVIRSGMMLGLFLVLVLRWKAAPEINEMINRNIRRYLPSK